jgi:hypothetical protein
MGLFNKASIVMTPNGVKAGKVYSVKPSDGDGDFTFSRATVANKEASNGLIQETAVNVPRLDYSDGTCPALLLEPQSTNLITYPLSFPNNYWAKSKASIEGDASTATNEVILNGGFAGSTANWGFGAGWAYGANNIIATATSSNLQQNSVVFNNTKTYKITIDISGWTSGSISRLQIGGESVPNTAIDSNGSHVFYHNPTVNSTQNLYIVVSGFSATIDNISIKEVQGFVSPDGTSNAYKLVPSVAAGSSYISLTASTGLKTNSFFLKKGELSYVSVGNAAYVVVVDLILGALSKSSDSINNYSIEKYPNGWYRVSIYNKTASNYQIQLFTGVDSNGVNITNNGTSGVYIYGAQLEALPYATSLMLPAVEGSTVTRVADLCTNSGTVNDFNSAEGVLYADIAALSDDLTLRCISINDGTSGDSVIIRYRTESNKIQCVVFYGGVLIFSASIVASSILDYNKVALKYKSGDYSFWSNGVEVSASSAAAVPTGLNNLSLHNGTTDPFYGKVRGVQVYKEALTDTELYDLTKPLYSTFDVMTNDLQYDTI